MAFSLRALEFLACEEATQSFVSVDWRALKLLMTHSLSFKSTKANIPRTLMSIELRTK